MNHDHHHGHQHGHDHDGDTAEFWERRYATQDRIWSGNVNAILAETVADLEPGRVLDLGCGEGGDTVHLAKLGWKVTAVDISQTALDRARSHAEQAGVSDLVATERHDLAESFPDGEFDLVSAQYFQSPLEFPRHKVLRRAAEALVPGGLLLLVDHGSVPPWSEHFDAEFPSPEQVLAEIDLDEERFRTERLEAPERIATGPNGRTGPMVDNIVSVRRLS